MMKTPREILLQRHESATPALDRIRNEVIGRIQSASPSAAPRRANNRTFAQALWLELFVCRRRVWAGLTAVWLLILWLAWASSGAPRPTSPPALLSGSAVAERFRQEQQLLSDFDPDQEPATPPAVPRTRTAISPPIESV